MPALGTALLSRRVAVNATVAMLRAFDQPLNLEPIGVPSLDEGQVLVQIEAAGICGSDVHMWRGRDPRTPLPMILGHEGVGRVVDIKGERLNIHGERVTVGDRILWERGVTCGQCAYCTLMGEPALCPHRWVYGIYRSAEQPPYLNGCYATHLILDARTIMFPIEENEDPATYVAASCSGATAAHGFDLAPVQVGDTVVILGPGPLGAFAVALARAGGAEHIIVVGGTRDRLALCVGLGATLCINRRETGIVERAEAIMEVTRGRGANIVVEASGSMAAAQEALGLVGRGGAVLLIGFGTPVGNMQLAPFEALVHKNVRLQGVWVSGPRHTHRAMSLVRQHPDAFAQLVTHRLPLSQATDALRLVADRQAMKAVLLPNEGAPA